MTLKIHAPIHSGFETILTDEALGFVEALVDTFGARRAALLAARKERQKQISAGMKLDFRADTQAIREGEWKVAPIPAALQDRRVEITGPAEPKMMINALNSGAKVFMADLEDSLSPTWDKVIEGQIALGQALRRSLSYTSPEGKAYILNKELATLIVRPRGWHLEERHITKDGQPVSGSLVDFGLFFFHNAHYAAEHGVGPFFYIPKLECMEEAQLWADVFAFAEEKLGIAHGTIKATVLIEVITAVFQMHEILYALKDYCVGLNCGRWDYIFSFIRAFHAHAEYVLPDRSQVTMTTHFLKSYSQLLIQTCHKRGAFAMGGMAAHIPVKNDEAANEKAFAAVRADKEREATAGHDGTWVAHPGLIPVAMEVFNRVMPQPNQLDRLREDVQVSAVDLLSVPQGTITEAGLRNNINVSVQYTAAWLRGQGCVPIHNLMEDAATAEISRSQVWQWVHHSSGKISATGENIDAAMVARILEEELALIRSQVGDAEFASGKYHEAGELVKQLICDDHFSAFLTVPAYAMLG